MFLSSSIVVHFFVLVNRKEQIFVLSITMHKKEGTNLCTLYERITELCKTKNVSRSRMCLELGLSKSTMSNMKNGRQAGISTETAQKMASYFNVSVGYLLGEEEKKEQSTESELSVIKKEFIQKIEKMTDAQIERLDQILALVEKTDL